jgi:chromate transporter
VGYQINGISGALIATLAIFLPSFVFVALLNPLVKRMRNSKPFALFLDGVNVASIAIIVSICYELGKNTITDWRTILIAVVSIVFVFNYKKVNSAFVVLGGSLLGYLLMML